MRFSQLSNENVIYLYIDLTEMLHGSIEENAEEPRGERLKPDGWNSFEWSLFSFHRKLSLMVGEHKFEVFLLLYRYFQD